MNRDRNRLSLSSANIPIPPDGQSFLSVNSGHRRRASQPALSSSAPSVGSFLTGSRSSVDLPHSVSASLTIEFDGGANIIVRPNRIIRGNHGPLEMPVIYMPFFFIR
jgi:hypothetical protein